MKKIIFVVVLLSAQFSLANVNCTYEIKTGEISKKFAFSMSDIQEGLAEDGFVMKDLVPDGVVQHFSVNSCLQAIDSVGVYKWTQTTTFTGVFKEKNVSNVLYPIECQQEYVTTVSDKPSCTDSQN